MALAIEISRSLTPEDLPALTSERGAKPPSIQALRASHHQLAQLLAKGLSETEVALITGYSLNRISILMGDPAFKELLANYVSLRQQVFVDVLERMRVLGLSSLDELQERLESSPEKWSHRELLEMADLMLNKPRIATAMGQASAAAASATGNRSGVVINVKFVSAEPKAPLIDSTAKDIPVLDDTASGGAARDR